MSSRCKMILDFFQVWFWFFKLYAPAISASLNNFWVVVLKFWLMPLIMLPSYRKYKLKCEIKCCCLQPQQNEGFAMPDKSRELHKRAEERWESPSMPPQIFDTVFVFVGCSIQFKIGLFQYLWSFDSPLPPVTLKYLYYIVAT